MIIFSRNLSEHLDYLLKTLNLLESAGITLSISKYVFAFPLIKALGHHISRLGLYTLPQKVAAILVIAFPSNLRELKHVIGFFGYYRNFINHYAVVTDLMVRVKTKGFKDAVTQGNARKKYTQGKILIEYLDEEELRRAKASFKHL